MRWPFVESELHNSNVIGWLTPVLTVGAIYYVDDFLLGAFFLVFGVLAGALLIVLLRRPWWQQLLVLAWAAAPIAVTIVSLSLSDVRDRRATAAEKASSPPAR
jgi:hypothetical protein